MPELTPEQHAIRDDFMKFWHEHYPEKHGGLVEFNNRYVLPSAKPGIRTLEIGAGLGQHLDFEDISGQDYVALELRQEMADALLAKHPEISTHVGDVEEGLDVPDASFDRVIAVHVLEHLRNLPVALDEIKRLLKPGGVFEIVIPCEGGLGYWAGRRVTSQRLFEKRYGTSYDWYIKTEHFSVPREIVAELDQRFERTRREFWPLKVPSVHVNLCIGLTYRKPA